MNIGNTFIGSKLIRAWPPLYRLQRLLSLIGDRSYQQWSHMNESLFRADRFKANINAAESMPNEARLSIEGDLPSFAHPSHFKEARIAEHFRHFAIRDGGGAINLCRTTHSQPLVRPLPVELPTPLIESALLGSVGPFRRTTCLIFKRSVHAFMHRVLLWVTRLNKLNPDPQLNPPHTQLCQPARSPGAKRSTVVHPDHFRQSILSEDLFKYRADNLCRLAPKSPTSQNKAAIEVAGCQWVAALSVSRAKPSLEIYAPDVVSSLGLSQAPGPAPHCPTSAPSATHQPVSLQNASNGARSRYLKTISTTLQRLGNLLRTPLRMPLPLLQYPLDHLFRRAVRAMLGRTTILAYTIYALLIEALLPLIACLATNPVALAKLRHRPKPKLGFKNKPNSFFHRRHISPRHRSPPWRYHNVLPMLPV
jgi:hypothetical protein